MTNYTFAARRWAFDYPAMTSVWIHVNFWVIAYVIMGIILYFDSAAIAIGFSVVIPTKLGPYLIGTFLMGAIYGFILGLSDYYLFKKWGKGRSLGTLIIAKGLFFFSIMILIFALLRYGIWQYIILPLFFDSTEQILNEDAWKYYFYIIALYTLTMSILISFITQMNNRFGPGVLIPLLLGKYIRPKVEERVFIFLDLKSSTTHAENLGHIRYSELIRDCFLDINQVSIDYQAEIYQYVGDEIVLCWLVDDELDLIICIDFYFACNSVFDSKRSIYLENYGIVPVFKAGLHLGMVTGVEVGSIKREVAYHGDTLNVAARIQGKCNEYESNILISDTLEQKINWGGDYGKTSVGSVILSGRKEPITVYKIDK